MKNAKSFFVITLLFLVSRQISFSQVLGDLRSNVVTGNWTTVANWQQWNGTTWVAAATYPSSSFTKSVTIQTGHTITVDVTGPYSCKNLTVAAGGKLYCNSGGTNIYINITGNIKNNGVIGNPGTFDCLAFNFEGTADTISGTGVMEVSRMRKNTVANPTTNLVLLQNVTLRFGTSSTTQIYNNVASSNFNVTIAAGDTLNLTGDVTLTTKGHASLDGIDGKGLGDRGGSYNIYGAMLVSGTIYLTNDNTSAAYPTTWNIYSGGLLQCGQVVSAASGLGKNYLNIFSGGKLKITGNNAVTSTFDYPVASTHQSNGGFNWFSTTNNVYNLYAGDTVEYAATGGQDSLEVLTYSNLKLSPTSTTKNIFGTLNVNNDLIFSNPGGGVNLVCLANTVNIGGNLYCYYANSIIAGTGKFIFNGLNGTLQNINSVIGGPTFYNVEINSAPGVKMNCNVSVSNSINFINGKFDLNSKSLTVSNSAVTAMQRTNGFMYDETVNHASRVNWNIGAITGAHVFPFGVSNSSYIPFTFNLTSGTANTVTLATYGTPANNLPWPTSPVAVTNLSGLLGLVPDNRDATVDRFWNINSTSTPVADLTFTYQASELPISPYNTPNILQAQRYDATTDIWQAATLPQTASSYYATANGIALFGEYTLTPSNAPLPVELISFSGEKSGTNVNLKWTTLSEIDNSYYAIERSQNGLDYLPIGKIWGSGNSTKATDYFFTDQQPFAGLNYYRLKQVDKNGSPSYQNKIVTVSFENASGDEATCYVDNQSQTLNVFLPKSLSDFSIRIFDAQGKLVFDSPETKATNSKSNIDISAFRSGVYLLNIGSSSYFKSFKLMIH